MPHSYLPTNPDDFFYMPRDHLLSDISTEIGGIKILETLNNIGLYEYGHLLDYAEKHDFSELSGIGKHGAEQIHQFIHAVERANKAALLKKYLSAAKKLGELNASTTKHKIE